MKRLAFLLLMVAALATGWAQDELPIRQFKLDNGLKVVLVEEHSKPQIYGGVLVHAGSKDEDTAITGVAHYFEHMMFKGTDRIGTIDWPHEKLYLDSISAQYDLLHATRDAERRKAIQREINRLNIAASDFAIPNEVDAILSKIGCTGVNAGTSYDMTVYYNALPSNQLETWMDIYVERFRNPIFRLFQSELEAVYEEKNMYEDNPIYSFQRELFTESFGEHPYSRDVIGYGEHLKNPQPSEMRRFFETYYVANNMTLILVGDFTLDDAAALVEKKFGVMRSGELPKPRQYSMPDFATQKIKTIKATPLPMGMVLFPSVPSGHPDEVVLQVVSKVLSDNGLLDRVVTEGKMMACEHMAVSLKEGGINGILYVPNLLQKHEVAEATMWACLDSLKNGRFGDDLLEAIKVKTLFERKRQIEDMEDIYNLMLSLAMNNQTYDDWLKENETIARMTKEDVMQAANRYFDKEHCTIIRSKIGFPAKDVVAKPDWQHLEAKNTGLQSEFAQEIYSRKAEPVKPQQVDFKHDLTILHANDLFSIYATKNPKNNIFSLSLCYRYGEIDDPDLDRAIEYFNQLGAGDMDHQRFQTQLDMLGGAMYLSCDDEWTTLVITGFDENFDKIMDLVKLKFDSPRHDKMQIDKIVQDLKSSEKTAKEDVGSWLSALAEYASYGSQSSFLRSTPIKEWKERSDLQLMSEVNAMFRRNGYITFSGNVEAEHVAEMCRVMNFVRDDAEKVGNRAFIRNKVDENQVFVAHNKKFGQSNIRLYYASDDLKTTRQKNQCTLFNEYFGGGMNSLVFQEIREFRSLGYATAGRFVYDDYHLNPGRMGCYLGTQCDKTNEGVEALAELVEKMPLREDKFEVAKDALIQSRNSAYYTFREIPGTVRYWIEVNGYSRDPRMDNTREIEQMSSSDMLEFYQEFVAKRPRTLLICGNAKRFDKKSLAKYGKLTKVKFSQLFRF